MTEKMGRKNALSARSYVFYPVFSFFLFSVFPPSMGGGADCRFLRLLKEQPREIKRVYLEASRLEYWRASFMKALKVNAFTIDKCLL